MCQIEDNSQLSLTFGKGLQVSVVHGQQESVDVFDFLDDVPVDYVLDGISGFAQNVIIGGQVGHFELFGDCSEVQVLFGQFLQLLLGDDGENEGNFGGDWDVDGYGVFLGHEDVGNAVEEVLPFLGLG